MMNWVCAIGTGGFATYTEKFKQYAGPNIAIDYFVYAASEGMFAAAVDMNDPQFMPLTDSCFFEFLPADICFGKVTKRDHPTVRPAPTLWRNRNGSKGFSRRGHRRHIGN